MYPDQSDFLKAGAWDDNVIGPWIHQREAGVGVWSVFRMRRDGLMYVNDYTGGLTELPQWITLA